MVRAKKPININVCENLITWWAFTRIFFPVFVEKIKPVKYAFQSKWGNIPYDKIIWRFCKWSAMKIGDFLWSVFQQISIYFTALYEIRLTGVGENGLLFFNYPNELFRMIFYVFFLFFFFFFAFILHLIWNGYMWKTL